MKLNQFQRQLIVAAGKSVNYMSQTDIENVVRLRMRGYTREQINHVLTILVRYISLYQLGAERKAA